MYGCASEVELPGSKPGDRTAKLAKHLEFQQSYLRTPSGINFSVATLFLNPARLFNSGVLLDMFLMADTPLPFELLRIFTAIAGLLVCVYFDLFNKKNVPDMLLYAFLAISFIVNIFAFNQTTSIYAIETGVVIFAIFYLLYRFGQLGGADVYILASIALLLPVQPKMFLLSQQSSYLSLPFMLNVIIATGISFMLWMLVKTFPVAMKALKTPGKIKWTQLLGSFAMVGAYAIFAYFISQNPIFPPAYFYFASVLVFLSLYFTLFKDAINDSMFEWVYAKDIEVEDILAVDKMEKEFVKKHSLSRLVGEKQLEKLKKIKSKIAVYKNLPPFTPHILIGLVFSILFGSIILLFMNM